MAALDPTAAAFLAALPADDRAGFTELDLGPLLADALARARAAHGELGVAPAALAAALPRWLPDGDTPAARLAAADAAEAYLVTACVARHDGALARFEADYFGPARHALAGMRLAADQIDEVLQIVRVRLLVGDGDGACRLAGYAGRGDLRGLVRVMATRVAIDQQRARSRLADLGDELYELPAADPDPALAAIRRDSQRHFAPAFEAALATLAPRERNLLRLHVVDGVALETLARSYQVHKTSVVRWLVKARGSLVDALVAELGARLDLPADEIGRWVAELRSQVDLSLSRMMATAPTP